MHHQALGFGLQWLISGRFFILSAVIQRNLGPSNDFVLIVGRNSQPNKRQASVEEVFLDEPGIDLSGHEVEMLEDLLGQGNRG